MIIQIKHALAELGAEYTHYLGEDINSIVWKEGATEIAVDVIQAEMDRQQAIEDKTATDDAAYLARLEGEHAEWVALPEWTRLRMASYPKWDTQLEMLYDDEINGTTTWKDAIALVKSDIPKE
jgi:hypothetical protein